jgi:excisionase family DNA binding protein
MKADHPKGPGKFYTIAQIAELMDVSKRTVRRWVKKGWLIAHHIDGLVRFSAADFAAFLAAHRDEANDVSDCPPMS